MFQEILHYTFKRSLQAFDISSFHQHGISSGVGFSKDGAAPNSGATLFNGQNSRIRVPFGEVWQKLDALKVEALVNIDELGERQNLVEGFLSFALFVRDDGVVTGSFLAPKNTAGSTVAASDSLVGTVLGGGGSPDPFSTFTAASPDSEEPQVELAWLGVNSDTQFSLDGVKRTIAPGVWTRVTFIHNGFSLQLWLDDNLAGYRDDVETGILGVQPGGVHIGAWPGSNRYVLKGKLDEIRIWKFDPYFRHRQFFCRPMDFHAEACWRRLLDCIMRQWDDPAIRPKADKVVNCIYDAEQAFLRSIHGQGAKAIRESEAFSRRYVELWCAGAIDSPEMTELLREFGAWLENTTGLALDNYIAALFTCRQDLLAFGCDQELKCIDKCDANLQAFSKLISEHALPGICSPRTRSAPIKLEKSYTSSSKG